MGENQRGGVVMWRESIRNLPNVRKEIDIICRRKSVESAFAGNIHDNVIRRKRWQFDCCR